MCTNCATTSMRYSKPDVLCPEKLIIGISRFYVYHRVSGSPTLEQIEREVDSYSVGWLLGPLMSIWDTVIASTSQKLQLHQPDCPCRSFHEQSLLLALKCLANADTWGAHASLAAMVPQNTVGLLLPALRKIVTRLASDARVEYHGNALERTAVPETVAGHRQLH